MIKVEGLDPNLRPQQSRHEDDSAPRAKPQPNRCRDRLNNPLFMTPDPASLPSAEPIPQLSEKAMQVNAAQSKTNLVVPEKTEPSAPPPLRLTIPNETKTADKGRRPSSQNHLTQPLRCPVRICSKTFTSRNDFDDHKTVCIAVHYIQNSSSLARLITEKHVDLVARFGKDMKSEDPFISHTIFFYAKKGFYVSFPVQFFDIINYYLCLHCA